MCLLTVHKRNCATHNKNEHNVVAYLYTKESITYRPKCRCSVGFCPDSRWSRPRSDSLDRWWHSRKPFFLILVVRTLTIMYSERIMRKQQRRAALRVICLFITTTMELPLQSMMTSFLQCKMYNTLKKVYNWKVQFNSLLPVTAVNQYKFFTKYLSIVLHFTVCTINCYRLGRYLWVFCNIFLSAKCVSTRKSPLTDWVRY